MKIKRLFIGNIFTCIWIFVLILGLFAAYISGGEPFTGGYILQEYIIKYYIFWPDVILFNIFCAKVDPSGIYPTWIIISSLIVSLCSCIIIDFLLRKFLWNKIDNKKMSKILESANETN